MTLTLAFVTALLANCVLLLGAKQILSVFGHVYADQATWTLRILGLSAFPVIIKDHYIALCRIKRRLMNAASLITAGAILELSAVVLGAHFGSLSGLSLGWVIAVSIEAVVMFPTVFRAARLIDASTP